MRLLGLLGVALVTVTLPLAAGCSSGDGDGVGGGGGNGGNEPVALDPLTEAKLTTDAIIEPLHSVDPQDMTQALWNVPVREKLVTDGFGDYKTVAGEPIVETTMDGSAPPAPGPNAKMLSRFVHLADTQLVDDESPARVLNLDSPGLTGGAFRPQEGYACRVLNAAVRTINKYNETSPVDFVVLGGDNADNAQTNEIDWFQAILSGSDHVQCDSGDLDDPVPGPNNDPKDPFIADGLDVPWRWVTGNHDILNQGNFATASRLDQAIGTTSTFGTRDWSQPGGPIIYEGIVPDERRAFLSRSELMSKVLADGDGHGIDSSLVSYGKAYYTFDVGDSPLRILVIDSAAETGSADGVIHQADIDKFMKPALDKAKADGKLVIMTSHHSSIALTDGGGLGGSKQADALTTEQFQAFVGGYDNVLMHLAAHTHVHLLRKIEPTGGHAYWEMQTAALADFPHQMRVLEVYDQDNGYISIRGLALDYSNEGDPLTVEARKLGIVDYTSGWQPDGRGDISARNVEVWIKKP